MVYRLISDYPEYNYIFLFANTGKEREETLRFVDYCDKRWDLGVVWLEAKVHPEMGVGTTYKVVSYETASRNGEPFKAMIDKYGLPNKSAPICTKELKTRPLDKWVRDNVSGPWKYVIGMRADERGRTQGQRAAVSIYPMVTLFPTFEVQVRNFWAGQPYDLELKDYEGNCDLCWKKSRRKRLTILEENPHIAEQWQKWEENSEYVFDRDGFSIARLLEYAERGKFHRAVDLLEVQEDRNLFTNIDAESSCFCRV